MEKKVQTRSGEVCRFPDGSVLTEKPEAKPVTPFLTRRLRDGSVIDAAEKPSVRKNTTKKKDADK